MCGAWRLASGGRSGGGGLECDTAEGQDQAQEQAWPHYYHTTTATTVSRSPADGPHTAPRPQASWRGHTRHRMTASPGPGPGLCQVHSLLSVRGLSWVRPGEITLQLAGSWGLVQTPECRSETGPGLGLNTEHNTATDTCHYTQLRRTQWQPWPAKIKFFGSVKTISWERRDEFCPGYEWYGVWYEWAVI